MGFTALAMGLAWGCRAAPTPTGPARTGPDTMPPSVVYAPAQDTLVDSIGVLNIQVAAHDQSLIDSVALLIQGAPITFATTHPEDTVFVGIYPIPLASLHHQPFSYAVAAADILGRDTTTQRVTVRLR